MEECNPATVQKALKILEKQGLIVIRGSKGYFVTESEKKIIELRNQHLNVGCGLLVPVFQERGVMCHYLLHA